MKKKALLKIKEDFIEAHPRLMELNPQIFISESFERFSSQVIGIIKTNPPIIEIEVFHPFIFDNRLVPEEFNGIKVKNWPHESPNKFPYIGTHSIDCFDSIEAYVKFVDIHFNLIREKLKQPNLSRFEALEALTGGVNELVEKNIITKKNQIRDEINNMAFFYELLFEIDQAYYLSDIYSKFKEKACYYALSSTRLIKHKPLIIGLNWQLERGEVFNKIEPQIEYPFEYFEKCTGIFGPLQETIKYFHRYHPKALMSTHSNLCFFRSEEESQISDNDIELCKSIFIKLLNYLNPPYIISFTDKFPKAITDDIIINSIDIPKGESKIKASKGIITTGGNRIGVYILPHPNLNITKKARKKAWKFCFEQTD